MASTDQEIDHLRTQPLARLATVGTRKFVNVGAGRRKVALVIDDPEDAPRRDPLDFR